MLVAIDPSRMAREIRPEGTASDRAEEEGDWDKLGSFPGELGEAEAASSGRCGNNRHLPATFLPQCQARPPGALISRLGWGEIAGKAAHA